MGFVKLYFAIFFDENGEYLTTKYFDKTAKKFEYKDKSYNINRKEGSYFEKKGLLYDKRYYFYNIDSSDPFKLKKPAKIQIDPELYNTILKTKVTKDLNTVSADITDYINAKTIPFILIALGIAGYIIFGG